MIRENIVARAGAVKLIKTALLSNIIEETTNKDPSTIIVTTKAHIVESLEEINEINNTMKTKIKISIK